MLIAIWMSRHSASGPDDRGLALSCDHIHHAPCTSEFIKGHEFALSDIGSGAPVCSD